MKKKYGALVCIVFLATACSSDQSSPLVEDQPIPTTSTYEAITDVYQHKGQDAPTKKTTNFLGWIKRVGMADAKAAGIYAIEHNMEKDWKEALIVGATASLEAALLDDSSKKKKQAISGTKPYPPLVLTNIDQIKSAEFHSNSMDQLGYSHYVLVNEVLKDPTLATISPSDRKGVLYDKIYKEAQKLNIVAPYDKQEAVNLLTKIQNTADNESDAYYTQLYAFKNTKDLEDYKKIAKLYTSTFFKLKSSIVFTEYSKEIETAVLQDASLSQTVKNVLLLEMATYRFGFTYYSSGS